MIHTADDAHENKQGERLGVSPPCQSHSSTGGRFQNTLTRVGSRCIPALRSGSNSPGN